MTSPAVGIVVIGRNEGARLREVLQSVSRWPVVYVDSGSTDSSLTIARQAGVDIVELDPSRPFTAARARNQGVTRLRTLVPGLSFVQCVDGDTTLVPGWIENAANFLASHPSHAAVCGSLQERFAEKSLYNRLCQMEWNEPPGDCHYCGGNAMFRIDTFTQHHGFREDMVAGEEPELCVRLRQSGWSIHRLSAAMGIHDADMTCFSQWWRRAVRAGIAFAQGAAIHGKAKERHWVKEVRSNWIWGLWLPLLIAGTVWTSRGWSLLALSLYGFLLIRITLCNRIRCGSLSNSLIYATFCMIAKLAHVIGQVAFLMNHGDDLSSTRRSTDTLTMSEKPATLSRAP